MRILLVVLLGLSVFAATVPTLAAGQTSNGAQASLAGFSLTVTPDTLNIQNESSANAAIIVTSQGLNGVVKLGASVSPNYGLQAVTDPSSVLILQGGSAASTLEINATSAQIGGYKINVTGSAVLASSQWFIVTVHVTGPASQPSASPPSSPPPSTSGANNQQPSTVTSGSNPKAQPAPKGQGSQLVSGPVGVMVAGNVIAAVGTVGAIASMYRKRSGSSRSNTSSE